jgi:DNA-binding CsgD family transcriptional regulator
VGATADELLATAQAAVEAGDIDAAHEAATASLAAGDTGDGRFLLGVLRMMDERYEEAAGEWQAAFGLYRDAGDRRRAARAAIEVARLFGGDIGFDAMGRGWLERARAVLEDEGPCAEWGHLELATMACDRPDVDEVLVSAGRALAIAVEHGDPGLEARALADGGLALVSQGRTREGFARLEAALATISAGGVDWDTAGLCYCSMLTACDRAADMRRAVEWTRIADQLTGRLGGRLRVMHTHCRVAYGSVLCATGQWSEAESQLLDALGPAASPTIAHRPLAVAHLADLRLDQGRVDEAADLLAPFEDWVTSCGPLSRVHRARGQLDLAAAVARRGVSEMVGDALRTAPLLALLVEVELDRGDHVEARAAADQLAALAARVDLPAVQAAADVADGRVRAATGDRAGARAAFAAAKARLVDGDSPMALAGVRTALAELLAADGDSAAAVAEARAALACFDRLGARPARDRVDALLRSLGDTARSRPRDAATAVGALTRREREVLDAVARGQTNAEIAEDLFISPKTVEHHVGRVLSKLGVRSRAEAAALSVRAAAAGPE